MKRLLTVLLATGGLYAAAQKVSKPDAYAKTITAADLKKHLYILAAPDMEGRETGTEGQRKAAAYIEAQFKAIGLQPGNGDSYQQMYALYQDSMTAATIEVNGKAFEMDKDFSASPATQATYRLSEVVVINSGLRDSLKNMDLSGKAVMVLGAANGAFYRELSKRSPAAVLMVSSNFPRTAPSPRKGRQGIRSFSKAVSAMQFQVSEALAKAIAGDGYDAVKGSPTSKLAMADVMLEVKKVSANLPASNVIALLPGTDLKDEYVVISAHYDHVGKNSKGVVYPGADDDGSGTVGIMELAEAFAKASKEGKGPRRSIVFLANSGEEKGLLGSEWYTDHPVYPLNKTTVNLNIDMIGRSDVSRKGDTVNYVYVVGDDKLSSDLKPISEAQNNKYTKLQLDYKFNDPQDPNRIYFRSDHYNFARYGVPIIFYYDGMLGDKTDYHQPGDTPDKVNYDLLQRRAQLVFYTAWEMANRNEMLKRDIPLDGATR